MKNLKFSFALNSKVSVYVPATKNVDEQIDNTAYVKRVIKKLSELFGGATATQAVGGWVTELGDVVLENTTIVYSFCKESELQANFSEVYELCQQIKNELNQEAVSLEINGQLAFV
jgi:hypothetical protein